MLLDIAIALRLSACADAQIEFLDVGVVGERFGRTIEHDTTVFPHHIAIRRRLQRHVGVLLTINIETPDSALICSMMKDVLHEQRRKTQRWLIEQH